MSESQKTEKTTGTRQTAFHLLRRGIQWSLIAIATYLAVVLIGLIPVNNDFKNEPNGIEIFVASNAIHADIIVPVKSDVIDWRNRFSESEFGGPVGERSHIAFGWGDRGFFLETEKWEDLRLGTAANALLMPSKTCVHVSFTRPGYFTNSVSVRISPEKYKRLVEFIQSSFQKDKDGEVIHIKNYSYSSTDAFYEGRGRYHLFNTCNSWVGRGLKTAGVRVPWLSPLPRTPMLYIDSD